MAAGPPRIEGLQVKNYRALRDIQFDKLTPLTVLLGANGSGKSTVFDVFAFLAECFGDGLRKAWDRRSRFRELRSREADGPILIEIRYRERPGSPLITYHLEIDENLRGPVVRHEYLKWRRGRHGKPFAFLDYELGNGRVVSGAQPEISDQRVERPLSGPDVLAVNTLGQLAENPRVIALREFITGWHLSYLSASEARSTPVAGAEERLSQAGDNLPNVIQYLREQHPARLEDIFATLLQRLPKRLQAYAKRLREGEKLRLVVLLERDDDDCRELKGCLESMARAAGLSTKTAPHGDGSFFVVNRLAIEELEAWFLGDGDAIRAAFPRIGRYEAQASYRNPDQVRGGTWGRLFTVF